MQRGGRLEGLSRVFSYIATHAMEDYGAPLSIGEIACALGLGERMVQKHIRHLKRMNRLRAAEGTYTILGGCGLLLARCAMTVPRVLLPSSTPVHFCGETTSTQATVLCAAATVERLHGRCDVAELAAEMRISRRQVQKCVSRLGALGHLVVIRHGPRPSEVSVVGEPIVALDKYTTVAPIFRLHELVHASARRVLWGAMTTRLSNLGRVK